MSLIDNYKIPESRPEPNPGTLYIVGTPIGNLGDLSDRAKNILKTVTLIACEDTRKSGQLLKRIGSNKPLLSYHQHNTKSRLPQILKIIQDRGSVALISDAGLPGISDPGEELVHAAKQNNYEVICIPGPCAAITALVTSGLPSQRFCFEGFLPTKKQIREKVIKDIAEEKRTTIIYESPHRLIKLLEQLSNFCGRERPIQVSRELTKRYEESIGSTIGEVLDHFKFKDPQGEFTLVLEGKSKFNNQQKISESEAIHKLKSLIIKGEKSITASKKIAKETGYDKKWLYSQLNKKLDK
ncbi:16S rRNA (cytidine(1402)-2'-O)-methyltransferase [Prochlorococcus marinus]|uniref:16S rRNA (cytidine(1402)-2'-O)-methyltransferase n=1 Tax=Prochlorococcus marinus TaxID=1219 RepID=UPI0022B2D311|nr:16S rRNA (cytidine(1402)-2'-O)-methyltransferase [Prochlorococcus marinus]